MDYGYIFLILFLLLLSVNIIGILLYLRKRKKKTKDQIDYIARIVHDMRTPIYSIDGYILLAEQKLDCPEKVKEYLVKTKNITQQLLAVVNDSVDYSKANNHKMSIENQETNLREWLQKCLSQIEILINNKGIKFVKTISIRHEKVWVDQDKLSKIILNLLSNALKYTKSDGVISLAIAEKEQNNLRSTYVFEVQDTGIGMSKEFQKHIFEPFSQEKTLEHTDIASSGLGMSLVKCMVDLIGGKIEVESKEFVGTKFTLTLECKLL